MSPRKFADFALPVVALAVALAGYFLVSDRPDRKLISRTGPDKIVLSLADCPPPSPGYTEVLSIVVHSAADGNPAVSSCTRYAERNYYQKRSMK